ncbi:HAD family hydrolase [Bacillus sp. EB600]|uniref:HAD family hydrolase n=1 Tax=Bacillus sp. EB600 TaxID=2806345 RepID=UPI00210C0414|nr:HAD family hydrolase [Bacillus sp. EB600]MCQ6278891.1 HAD family hydrolase [Bacillus sp. EB600]
MKIKALIFDMDDTLFNEIDYIFSGYKAVDKWLRENFEIVGFYNIATFLFNNGIRKNIFNKSLELLKMNFNEGMIIDMVNVYRGHEPTIQLLEDARWVLQHLLGSTKLGLISDGYLISQEKKVNALKIEEQFHSIILTDKLGRKNWKPSPIPYIQASKELNCQHHECIYIGDNVSKDFITAKRLGWKTVHICRENGIYSAVNNINEYSAHYQIRDLRELYNIQELEHVFVYPIDNKDVVIYDHN